MVYFCFHLDFITLFIAGNEILNGILFLKKEREKKMKNI